MAKFMLVYHGGGMPEGEAEQARVMGLWNDYYGKLGEAVVDGGAPLGMSATVSASGVTDDGGANPVSGYTVIEAADRDAACALAKHCPMVVEGNGSVEVAEVIPM